MKEVLEIILSMVADGIASILTIIFNCIEACGVTILKGWENASTHSKFTRAAFTGATIGLLAAVGVSLGGALLAVAIAVESSTMTGVAAATAATVLGTTGGTIIGLAAADHYFPRHI